MKDLKNICNINIPNSLHSLLEASVLGDIEDTLASMDKYDAVIKKAERDWKKLLKSRRFMHLVGDTWCIKLKSPELIEYLGQGHPSYEKYKDIVTQVMISFFLSDAIAGHNYPRTCYIKLVSNSGYLILRSDIEYCNDKNPEFEELTKYSKEWSVDSKNGCNAILDVISRHKDLQDLNKVKEMFDKHITYERK